jgi:hypothetical protein
VTGKRQRRALPFPDFQMGEKMEAGIGIWIIIAMLGAVWLIFSV